MPLEHVLLKTYRNMNVLKKKETLKYDFILSNLNFNLVLRNKKAHNS